MILADPATGDPHRILAFGAGLIGTSVIDSLRLRTPLSLSVLPLDWSDASRRATDLAHVESEAMNAAVRGARISILWSAGRAGFNGSEQSTALELDSWREVLAMSARIAGRFKGVAFHLVSSAGALFEGQRLVTRDAEPLPRRPYGRLKLEQERLLLAEDRFAARCIYRVSTAYGPLRPNVRAGLVSALLLAAARREVTRITGRMDTLRDFVFSDDVGAFIADAILGSEPRDEISVLASGRPSSLMEVQSMVEQVVGRRLLVTYERETANAEDITFAASLLPPSWQPSDLRWNIGRLHRRAVIAGTW
ncbi:MAG TPA: NAD-dependent epimerase/dehydratase family protein [Thermoanaerobaculia bacterium]